MQALSMTATTGPITARARIADAFAWLERFPRSLRQLLFRLAVGSVFMKAGLTKVASWETTVALFRDEYRVPVLSPEHAATMAATFELGCSALLIAGLATRLATLPLLGMLAVIQTFVYPEAWSDHLTWGAILVAILTAGAGRVSLDRLLGLER
jgi:putative oxidoreductase